MQKLICNIMKYKRDKYNVSKLLAGIVKDRSDIDIN